MWLPGSLIGLGLSYPASCPSARDLVAFWLDCLDIEASMDWRLADAKNRFSELFTQVLSLGPQRVRRFKDAVIVLSEQEYERITGRRPSFKDFLSQGESFVDLNFGSESEPPEISNESAAGHLCAHRTTPSTRQRAVKATVALIPDDDLYLSALIVGDLAGAIALLPAVAESVL